MCGRTKEAERTRQTHLVQLVRVEIAKVADVRHHAVLIQLGVGHVFAVEQLGNLPHIERLVNAFLAVAIAILARLSRQFGMVGKASAAQGIHESGQPLAIVPVLYREGDRKLRRRTRWTHIEHEPW